MQVTINDRTARQVASWGSWAQVGLDELVNRICCQWLADQELNLGNNEEAREWLESEGADEVPQALTSQE